MRSPWLPFYNLELNMPGGSGKARHSCKLCKPNKFAGNGKRWGVGSRTPKEEARAPGHTKSERQRAAREMAED